MTTAAMPALRRLAYGSARMAQKESFVFVEQLVSARTGWRRNLFR